MKATLTPLIINYLNPPQALEKDLVIVQLYKPSLTPSNTYIPPELCLYDPPSYEVFLLKRDENGSLKDLPASFSLLNKKEIELITPHASVTLLIDKEKNKITIKNFKTLLVLLSLIGCSLFIVDQNVIKTTKHLYLNDIIYHELYITPEMSFDFLPHVLFLISYINNFFFAKANKESA